MTKNRPLGAIAYGAYVEACVSGCRPEEIHRAWDALHPKEQRIWAAVENAVGDETLGMVAEVLNAFGVKMPRALREAIARITKQGKPQ